MGIGGSGMSGVAGIAHELGYIVDGCDVNTESLYLDPLRSKIKIFQGHSVEHTKDKDILIVSPAIYYKYPPESEIRGFEPTLTWQEFLGKYLHKGYEVVAVSGTHGKSTTTALLAQVFTEAGLDPTVMVGAKVPGFGANYRVGKGTIFVTEADEFYDNFLNYSPETIILNNLEFDHPDYFPEIHNLYSSFVKHILSLRGKKILIVNGDSIGVRKLLRKVDLKRNGISLYMYSTRRKEADFYARIIERSAYGTRFIVSQKGTGQKEPYSIKLYGDHNVSNILGVIAVCSLYSIKQDVVRKILASFEGIGRRLELIGKKNGIFIYDDYAHHPTAIKATLSALRQKHPISRIFAVVEPHSYSRTKSLIKYYVSAFNDAYSVTIAPIFKARDKKDFGMTEGKLAGVIDHARVGAFASFEQIATSLPKELKKKDVVVVLGAGNSSELAMMIKDAI